MTVKECYEVMKGDYDDVLSRLRTDERIKKFLIKVLSDPSFSQLCTAMDSENMEEAFRAAHTLKGLAVGMGFTALYDASYALTEALRPNDSGAPSDPGQVRPLFDKTEEEYDKVLEAYNTKF